MLTGHGMVESTSQMEATMSDYLNNDRARRVYDWTIAELAKGHEVLIQTGRQVGRVRSTDDIRLIDNGRNLMVRHGRRDGMLCHLGPQIARAWSQTY